MIILIMFLTGILTSQATAESKNLANANNDFSIKIYKSLPSAGNTFFSPASIFTALGMLYKGAGGNTAQEMRQALSYETAQLNDETIHQKFKDLLDFYGNSLNEYTLEIANGIVTSTGYSISEDYKEALKTYYNAITKEVNFRSEKQTVLNEVNSWVSERTHGKIPKILDHLDANTVMALLNAVYFKGTWHYQFNESLTTEDIFYANGKDPKSVSMMNQRSYFSYSVFQEEKFKAFKLPYKGKDLSMTILLPNEKDGLKDLESALTVEMVTRVKSSLNTEENKVKVSLPKFKLEDSRKLVENLKQLGMRDAFKPGAANFIDIDKTGNLFVSDVVHKAVVEVNEEGTVAVDATAVSFVFLSAELQPPEFIVDHPFLFFIQDERTEMILFMGRLNEP